MKNHIKNYIKIMGLAAVPFGTAQADDYEIKVTQESKSDAEHFRISMGYAGEKKLYVAEIVWPHDKEYPNPISAVGYFFERMYDEEVRRSEDVFYADRKRVKDLVIHKKKSKAAWFENREINCFEWMRFFRNNGANNFERQSCSRGYFGGDGSCCISESVWSRMLCALNAGKTALDLAKDTVKMELERALELGYPRDCMRRARRCELPNDCSYVCYKAKMWSMRLFLMKDPQRLLSGSRYVLFIDIPNFISRDSTISVLSDVRTVFVGTDNKKVEVYCATSEILDPATRKKLCEGLLPGGFRYRLSDTVRSFVRVRSHANEQSMSNFESLPTRDCFEVESGRITGVWFEGKRMDTDLSKYVFKDLLGVARYVKVLEDPQVRKLVENRKEEKPRSSVYMGAINEKLLEKLEKKQAKPQNEIKLEEEEKEDKKIENNEIKNEIKEAPKKKKKTKKGKPEEEKKHEEVKKSEEDPFEPKKEEVKESNPFALTPPAGFGDVIV